MATNPSPTRPASPLSLPLGELAPDVAAALEPRARIGELAAAFPLYPHLSHPPHLPHLDGDAV